MTILSEIVEQNNGQFKNSDIFKKLINSQEINSQNINDVDKQGMTILHHMVIDNDLQGVELALKIGADVNKSDKFDFTPLHTAANRGNLDIIKTLIGAGAELLAINCLGDTPCLSAINAGNKENVEFIISKLSESKLMDPILNSPYSLDCAIFKGDVDMIKILLDINVPIDNDNLFNAASTGSLYFIEYMKNITDIRNITDSDGRNVLHYAYMGYQNDMVNYLVTKIGVPEIADKNGEMPADLIGELAL